MRKWVWLKLFLSPFRIYVLLLIVGFIFFLIPTEPYKANKIVNSHEFTFTHNPGNVICSKNQGETLFFLIYVHSNPNNFKNRLAIRETWGNKNIFPHIRVVFMLGTSNDSQINHLVKYEAETYGDIIAENFIDTYKNITYKAIMAMKWITKYCSKVSFIVKTDDDIVIDTFALWNYLKLVQSQSVATNRTIMCYINQDAIIDRNSRSKWYVSKRELSGKKMTLRN